MLNLKDSKPPGVYVQFYSPTAAYLSSLKLTFFNESVYCIKMNPKKRADFTGSI